MFNIARTSQRAAIAPLRAMAVRGRFASTSTEAQKKAEDGQDAVGEGLKKAGQAFKVGLQERGCLGEEP